MCNCPKCGSPNVEEDDSSDFLFGLAVGIPMAFGLFSHDFKCRKCGYEWSE